MSRLQIHANAVDSSGKSMVRGLRSAPNEMFRRLPINPRERNARNPWLHAYLVLTALVVWMLVFSGGFVTSKGVGLSVPDWPNSYGYNMFAFPVSRWVGGIFYEHTHRLLASGVGFLTIILCVWLWRSEPRRWMRWLGVVAFTAVVLQGLLGGLRVVLLKDQIGVFHACLAQAFLALISFLALATSGWWMRLGQGELTETQRAAVRKIAWLIGGVTILIFSQLALGAAMRHTHSGLSIRDFPTAYGRTWPPTDLASLEEINHTRAILNLPRTTAGLILLQMFHRIGAFAVAAGVIGITFAVSKRRAMLNRRLRWLASTGPVLIAMQILLGIYTIWTDKAADVATTHVAVGAASLVWGVLTFAAMMRWSGTPMIQPASLDEAVPSRPAEIYAEAGAV